MEAFWTEYVKVLALCASSAKVAADPHWTAYVTAFSTPLVAVLGLWIAYRQWATARDKLRLDLFERRLAVHKAVYDTLGQMGVNGTLTSADEQAFWLGTSASRWLFGKEVQHYLVKELWSKMCEHHMYEMELDGLSPGEERSRLVEKKHEVRKWFNEQVDATDRLFMPYMGFHQQVASRPWYLEWVGRLTKKI